MKCLLDNMTYPAFFKLLFVITTFTFPLTLRHGDLAKVILHCMAFYENGYDNGNDYCSKCRPTCINRKIT